MEVPYTSRSMPRDVWLRNPSCQDFRSAIEELLKVPEKLLSIRTGSEEPMRSSAIWLKFKGEVLPPFDHSFKTMQ